MAQKCEDCPLRNAASIVHFIQTLFVTFKVQAILFESGLDFVEPFVLVLVWFLNAFYGLYDPADRGTYGTNSGTDGENCGDKLPRRECNWIIQR